MPNLNEKKERKYSDAPAKEKAAVIVAWLEERKASDVTVLDLEGRASFTDVMIVATAASVRQAQALADGVNRICAENRYEFFRMSGYAAGQWILVDCNDVVVHVFQPETRRLYALESLWSVPATRDELAAMAEAPAEAPAEEDRP